MGGTVITVPYIVKSKYTTKPIPVGTPLPGCPRHRTAYPDTPGGVSLQEWDVEGTVPYCPISIRRAETSDWSGGFCSPYGSQNPPGTSLAPGPAGFTKNLVYFLCKVCYTVISVRRDGQTRAEKKRNTRAFCGQRDHLPDDSGSKGMALAAWYLCAIFGIHTCF